MIWEETNLLVSGGTGSFGRKFAEVMLSEHQPRRLIVFSRDELKLERGFSMKTCASKAFPRRTWTQGPPRHFAMHAP